MTGDIEVLTRSSDRPLGLGQEGADLVAADLAADNAPARTYGVAFHLGVGRLLCAFVDLHAGRVKQVASVPNPHGAYGATVAERLSGASETVPRRRRVAVLRRLLTDAMDGCIVEVAYRLHVPPGRVRIVVVAGDEDMVGFLGGDRPHPVPATVTNLGLRHASRARLLVLPIHAGVPGATDPVIADLAAAGLLPARLDSRADDGGLASLAVAIACTCSQAAREVCGLAAGSVWDGAARW